MTAASGWAADRMGQCPANRSSGRSRAARQTRGRSPCANRICDPTLCGRSRTLRQLPLPPPSERLMCRNLIQKAHSINAEIHNAGATCRRSIESRFDLERGFAMHCLKAVALSLALTSAPLFAAPVSQVTIAAAVSSSDRSEDNVKLDAGRKPAQVLKFLGLRRGMHVLDLFGGNAYWAEIMAPVV